MRVALRLSQEQREELKPLFDKMAAGEALMAQVFEDGIVCALLDKQTTTAIQVITGGRGTRSSAWGVSE